MKKKLKKRGFSLVELMLVLSIIAALSVAAFMTYKYVSEEMLIKKQLDFANDVVTTTRGLFNNTSLKPDSLQYGLNDAVMAELKMDSPYYAKLYQDQSNMKSPFLEYVTVALKSDYGNRAGNGQFIFIPQYPQAGVYTVSRCIKLANAYIGRFGNVQAFSGDVNAILSTDPNRQEEVQKMCDQYSGGSVPGGIGFVF